MSDSKAWVDAYRSYMKLQKRVKRSHKTKARTRNGPVRPVYDKEAWVTIQREYLRWRKTDGFRKWKRKQFLKQGGTCYYCDQPIYGGVKNNVDHVIPKIRRGDNRRANLVLACADCNKKKNYDMLPYKERQRLKAKNKSKKGTYLKTREHYPTEYDIAYNLREMFREE